MTYFDAQTEIRRENEEAKAPVDSMVIHLSDLDELFKKVADFNAIPLAQLVLIGSDGERIPFPDAMLKEWSFAGLSNKSFIEFRFWETQSI